MYNVSISTNNLTIGYRAGSRKSNAENQRIVQADMTFSLREGEMVCMLGPNGCGKSTLLRTLAGLQPALSGDFHLSAEGSLSAQRHDSGSGLSAKQSKSIALVLTERLSMDNTTVHDVVALGRYPYSSFLDGLTAEDEEIISTSLEQVGFLSPSSVQHSFFNAHSDGEKQRILIAKALAQQTPIILLDEPTAHLDLPHRILVLRLLRRLAHEQGKTILISTHELDLALALSDRILLMSKTENGKLINANITNAKSYYLDTAANLRQIDAFTSAFGMDIFNPLG